MVKSRHLLAMAPSKAPRITLRTGNITVLMGCSSIGIGDAPREKRDCDDDEQNDSRSQRRNHSDDKLEFSNVSSWRPQWRLITYHKRCNVNADIPIQTSGGSRRMHRWVEMIAQVMAVLARLPSGQIK